MVLTPFDLHMLLPFWGFGALSGNVREDRSCELAAVFFFFFLKLGSPGVYI